MKNTLFESIILGNLVDNSTKIEFSKESLDFTIDTLITDRIKATADKEKNSVKTFLFAACSILLSRYTREDENNIEIVVETENNSNQYKYAFVKNVINEEEDFRSLFLKAGCLFSEAFVDFNKEDSYHNFIFDTVTMLNEIPSLKELKFGILIRFNISDNGIYGRIEFNGRAFGKNEIEQFVEHFLNILELAAENPEIKLSEIDMLSEKERREILVDFNDTKTEYPRNKAIFEFFEEQVERTPDNIALVYEDKRLTYRELNEKSNQLARILREKGVKPDTIVGIMADRSLEMIVGIMAVVKAGGAYLPICPEYPEDRIKYMLEDSSTSIVLTQGPFMDKLRFAGAVVDLEDKQLYQGNKTNLEKVTAPNNLIYIIYTSGSTGNPKGVMIEHKSIVSLLTNLQQEYPLSDKDAYLLKTNYVFDVSLSEIFGWFFEGGKLVILKKGAEANTKEILDTIERNGVTHINFVPSMLRMFVEYEGEEYTKKLRNLKYMFAAGEAISEGLVQDVLNLNCGFKLENLYGPTEATVYAARYSLTNRAYGNNVPIGKPVANTKIYIVNKNNRLQPVGAAGELCIAGEGLARGYLNKRSLTEEKFVANPFEPVTKMYRTGDLARWLPDGNIEYIGRIDHQVKIRGFRIELGEIESQLLKIEGIKEAVVLDKQDGQGNRYLCAYIVNEREVTVPELRESLSKKLPDYMIPAYFMQIEKMPLTPTGKINRRALPEPDGEINTGVEYAAPRNTIEEKLITIWSDVLGLKKIGIDDNFFALGGHSLKAIKMVPFVQKELGASISVGEIFSNPTVRELGEYIGKTRESVYTSIEAVEEREVYKVSSAQKRLFALNQLSKEGTNYNIPSVMIMEGKMDKNKVEEAFTKLVQRHDAFRTSFEMVDNEIMQRIHKDIEFNVEYEEADRAVEEIAYNFVKPFDLSKAPLLRVKLVKLEEEKYALMLDMHHIISDGTSLGIIMEEFTKLYKGESLEELIIQFKDYSAWEDKFLNSESMKKQEEYWIRAFNDEIPILDLPTDYQRPSIQSFEGECIGFSLGKDLTEKLKKIVEANGATLYMTLLSAYNILLSKHSGQEDIVVGSPAAGRPHVELHNMVGMFVNTLAMRNYPEGKKTFKEFLQEVKKNALSAYENQDYQFDRLVEKLNIRRDLGRNPLFDTMFVLQNTDNSSIELEGTRIEEYVFKNRASKFDITLEAEEKREEIRFGLEYCTSLFKRETIKKLIQHFLIILKAVIENPEIKLSEIDMLSEDEEREILIDFNDTKTEYPKDKAIYEFFEEQAERTPDNIALVYENSMLTYRELNEKSNQLARILRDKGIKPDSIVGIMVDRSFEMIIGIMAIVKAGGAYLPISPEYPEDRIKYMLEDSRTRIVLTQGHYMDKLRFAGAVINLEDEKLYNGNCTNLEKVINPGNLIYVIYTSGSTGNPKGVMIEYKSAVSLLTGLQREYPLGIEDAYLLKTNYVFDVSVAEIFGWFFEGGRLVILKKGEEANTKEILDTVERNGVTHINFVPSMLRMFVDYEGEEYTKKMSNLKYMFAAGEAISEGLVQDVHNLNCGFKLENLYGPTEATVYATRYSLTNREYANNVPIGKPVDNIKIYIVNKNNKLQPVGVAGELCIAGEGLARGYLNRTELTEEKFVANPFEPGTKMYRTGDLARWLQGGNIEFMGRIDHQVKIRGFRIELGEIESQLLNHEDIKEAVVIDRQDNQGNKYLCAYIVSGREITVQELRRSLSTKLPEYMLPAYFIMIEKMPLTSNGKINRRALPEPDGEMNIGVEYAAPGNETEEKLVDIWNEVLGVERIGIDDDFFALGGHSLKAIKMASIIQKELMASISVGEIFSNSTIRQLGEYLGKTKLNSYSSIEVVQEREVYSVSSAQKRMFALNQFSKGETNYNIPIVMILEGCLDKNKLEESFNKLVQRHEALRTSFEIIDEEIIQRVHKEVGFKVEYEEINRDSTEIIEFAVEEFVKPFDLSKAPLLRVKLVRLKAEKHILMLDTHHIISDGTSMGVIMDEITRLCKGESLEELRVQYKDYSAWENKMLDLEAMKKQEKYWTGIFSNEIPVLSLPTDYPRPTLQSFEGECIGFRIDRILTEKLKQIGKANGATLYMTLLSAYNILLSKYSGQEDIIIGSPIAGRPDVELHNMVGMFVNTLAMRNYPEGKKTFREFLQEVRKNALSAYENQDYQFDKLVEKLDIRRDLSRSALLDAIFVLQNTDNRLIELDNIRIKQYEFNNRISKFDISLEAEEKEKELKFNLEYCTKLFKRETIERVILHFKNILEAAAKNPEIRIAEIDMLSKEESRKILVDFNNTRTEYPRNKTIQELFEEQVEKTPDKIAVVCKDRSLTYRELNEKANTLSEALRDKGVKADSIVGIMAERSLEMIVGIVSILKAGGAYLPIDPDYPSDRIKYMLRDSNAAILLTEDKFPQEISREVSIINLKEKKSYSENKENPERISEAENLAYVIYTSGTTGRPKGAAVIQRNVVRLVKNTNYIGFGEEDRILQTGSIAFDASTFEIWGALLNGIKLYITSKDIILNGDRLGEYILKNKITVIWLTSPLFNKICEDNPGVFKGLRCLLTGGDIVSPKNVGLVRKHVPGLTVVNGYGPTENTTFSTCYVIKEEFDENKAIPIGRPIANSTAYILDKNGKPVPIGVYGELCVGGDGLARGYLNNEELTEEKFVENPYEAGQRMYKTGDLARWLPDGNIEFSGRIDHQVKIRGYRIELGEIESSLLKLEGVKEAVVIDREEDGNKYLCAYMVLESECNAGKLREELKKSLPDYMIPSYFIALDEISLNQNGKIDRRALPKPDGVINTGVEYAAPRNEIEEKLIKIWNEVLGIERIGIDDDFFALGGHSLKAIKMVSFMQREIGALISVGEIFSNPTVRELGEYIGKAEESVYSAIEPVEEREVYKVSSAQRRMFALNQFSKDEINYNIPLVMILEGKLDKNKVEEGFRRLIERHEAFRTSFELVEDEIMQRIHKEVEFSVEYEEADRAIEKIVNSFITPFDLSKAPLLRVKLVKLEEEKHILMFDMHHIISDGTSMSIIMEEFTKLYRGEALEKLSIQYKDYSAWENKMLNSEVMKKQEEYWIKAFGDDISVLDMPTDYPRPSIQSFEGESIGFKIDKGLTEKLKRICNINGATLYMTLLSAYNILLSKYSGQKDIIVGSPTAGRPHIELHNMVGMFVNTLAMRNYPEGKKTFREFLQEVRKNALSAYENQDYQFDRLVEKLDIRRDLSRNALFDTMFVLQNTDNMEMDFGSIKIKQYQFENKVSKFDLTLEAEEQGEEIIFNLEYCTKLFKRETAEKIVQHFINILKEVAKNPEIKLAEIDMLSEEEKREILVDFNNTGTEYPKNKAIYEFFEEQVERTPDNIAAVYEDKMLTYRELNEKSNQLARILRDKGVKLDTIVGIMADRSLEMIVGIMAIVKAGGAYLPISPEYPEDRIKYMLEDSRTSIVLTQGPFMDKLRFAETVVDLEDKQLYQGNKTNLEKVTAPDTLIYIIYTSGSTGNPKGVMIEHKSIVSLLTSLQKEYPLSDKDAYLLKTNYVFDVSLSEIFGWFFEGGKLVILKKGAEANTKEILDTIERNGVTHINFVPSMLRMFVDYEGEEYTKKLRNLKYMFAAGEAISEGLVQDVLNLNCGFKFENLYGPTEATVYAARYSLTNRIYGNNVPIGKPVANTKIYIVDKNNRLQPIGAAGELCIAGEGLARGYLNKRSLTEEKFVTNPFEPGTKMYRTGDLARWLQGGNIEYLGRIDHQVKIRGFRIELGEIESQLLNQEDIKDAVVIDRQDNQGNKYICAYIVSEREVTVPELRGSLSKKLPDYMIPAYFIQIEKMPLTPTGKINRRALPEPDGEINTGVEYAAPRNTIEEKLITIWNEVLGVERIGIDDEFFTLGGHSLKAIRMVSIIQRELMVSISVGEIFSNPTVRQLGKYIEQTEESVYSSIAVVEEREVYKVSSAQKRMFALNQFSKEETNYNIPIVMILEGSLEKNKVEEAFNKLVQRHDAFRTSFELTDDEIMQRIHKEVEFKVEYEEIKGGSEEIIKSEVEKFIKPFDLSKAPLLRVKLLRLKEEMYVLMFDMHHIIADGTSLGIIMEEYTKLYKGESLEELRVQYKDYSAWENKMLDSEIMKKQEEYWTKVFSDEIPVLDLPTDYQRPSIQGFEGQNISFRLDKDLTEKLKKICKVNGATLYMTLLSAYNILLSKYSGHEDIIVGSPIAGRPHADLQRIIGMLVNTLAMRNYPEGKKTFKEFLQEVRKNALSAYENQNYQFDRLVEVLNIRKDLSRNPLFDTMFVLQNTENKKIEMDNIRIREYGFENNVSKFDIILEAAEEGEEIIFNLEYCTKLFKRETAEKIIQHFTNILKTAAENPEIRLAEIDMLSEEEKRKILVNFNETRTEYPSYKTIHELFEEQVERTPESIALVYEDKKLTYRELNERSNQLARVLRNKGINADAVVGIMVERSFEMIVGIIGILKAGGAYLPIDPEYPIERIKYMLQESNADMLLTEEQFLEKISFNKEIINLREDSSYAENGNNMENINSSNDLLYVIYTSGSTGKPKGVMITHRNINNLLNFEFNRTDIDFKTRILQFTTISFDVASQEIFSTLLSGGELYLIKDSTRKNVYELLNFIKSNEIEIAFFPTSFFKLLASEERYLNSLTDNSIRHIITAGEQLVISEALQRCIKEKGVYVHNHYGPSETHVVTTYTTLQGEAIAELPPIGKPICNTQIYILDDGLKPVPVGVNGELYISGDCLGRGYINREDLTSERFIENPFIPGEKMYKSGDVARWLTDGNIEYIGRIDHQVKIRGFRIELGEIESQLLKINGIKEAVVLDKKDRQENKYLCAYIVSERKTTVSELRESLSKKLPDYMIPAYFIQIEKMPLTPNGKINRKALPEPDGEINTGIEYAAPRNETEEKLIKIWNEVLDVEKIGIDDDFFILGGHSLKAIRMAAIIHRELKVEIPVSEIFGNSTVRKLGEYIGKARKSIYSSIKSVEKRAVYAVSSAQKRMFALNQFSKDGINYNIPSVMLLEGKLDENKVEEGFRKLIERHEAFRTSFELVDDEIMQRIHKVVEFKVEYDEIKGGSEEIIKSEVEKFIKPFDLSKAPLMRVKLLRLKEEKCVLILDMHHIISDGTSLSIVMEEFTRLYKGEALEELSIQYKDYSAWENEIMDSETIKKQEEYWTKIFSDDIPILDIPTDYPRPSLQSFEGEGIGFRLDKDLTEKLRRICNANGVTLYMALLSAYNILLSKHSGQEDIVVGSPIAGRPHADLHSVIGVFVNTLAMRNYPQGMKTFKEFLQEVKKNALSAYENQDYQFDRLVEKLDIRRDLSRSALFDTMFMLQNTENNEIKLDNIRINQYEFDSEVSKFDITLAAEEKGEEIEFTLEYCTKLFRRETIEKIIQHFINIIGVVTENPEIKLAEIDMLSEEEKREILVDFNNTKTEYPRNKAIYEFFEEQAERIPNNIALVYEDKRLTYRELNEKSNQLARILRDKGVKPDIIVGIMADRSLEMIIGIMAIVKAGGAYLPISPEYPEDRIKYMLEDSRTSIVLTQGPFMDKLRFAGAVVDLEDKQLYQGNKNNLDKVTSTNNLIYIIYTSGSTGNPKGVMIEHKSIVSLLTSLQQEYPLSDKDAYLLKTNYVFDVSLSEIFGWFFEGGKLVILKKGAEANTKEISDTIERNGVTHINFVPSMLRMFVDYEGEEYTKKLRNLKYMFAAGEAISEGLVQDVLNLNCGFKFENLYGPTEATVYAARYSLTNRAYGNNVPIGKPVANTKIYIVNKNKKLQPVGAAGELCIAGEGLARGYLNKRSLTEEKFVANPFEPGTKMYRTGDLARWLPDGNIEFMGRIDHQVKIRGFRIELGEIESQLLNQEDIKEAVVIDRQDNQGNKYLCAYIVSEREVTVPELRGILLKKLPDYMIPAYFMQIEKMPLTPTGKINRRALPEPDGEISTGVEYAAPRNEIEEKLITIWNEVLGVERIGIDDDFFTLGGHSLKAIRMVSIIHRELKVEIPVGDIFSSPTVRKLGEYIGKARKSMYSSIKSVEEREAYKVSSAQKRMFALNQFLKEETNYNIPSVMILEGKLDKDKVEKSFKKLIERHEAFRTSFEMVDDEIMQRIHKEVEFRVEYEVIKGSSEEIIKSEVKKFISPFDLSKAPLLRVKLLRLEEEKYVLMFDMHHIVSDGTSISIIMEEFTKLYKGDTLGEINIQYKDYSAWENEMLDSEVMKKQEEYWTKVFSNEIPVLNLPTDYQRPSIQSFEGQNIGFRIDKGLTDKLKKLCRDNGVTLYMALLSAYNILLSKYSGQEDIVVGSPIAGRPHADLQSIIGMFINTLAMRNYPEGAKTYNAFLQEVKKNALNAYENQDYQFDKLVEKLDIRRDLSRSALFDTMLVLQNTDNKEIAIDSIAIKAYEFENKVSKFDLTLAAAEMDEEIELNFAYCTKLFKRETIEKMIVHLKNILRNISDNPEIRLSDIQMLSEEEERRILVEFNDTKADFPNTTCIHQLFEGQAAKVPDYPAASFEGRHYTYKELNGKANQLANYLSTIGVGSGSRVAIYMERSLEIMIGLLGALKAGAAYIPIDPTYPKDRIEYMIEEADASVIITTSDLAAELDSIKNVKKFCIDTQWNLAEAYSRENLMIDILPSNAAYIIFTSGSTGKPKGVVITHKNIINYVQGILKKLDVERGLSYAIVTTFAADLGLTTLWGALCSGGQLHILSYDRAADPNSFEEYFKNNSIDVLKIVPSHFEALRAAVNIVNIIPNKYLIFGGEASSWETIANIKAIKPECTIINHYGPTETTVGVLTYKITQIPEKGTMYSVPLGRPLANSRAYILDKFMKPVPIGISGELYIGGDGVTSGYLNRPEVTGEKYITHVFPGEEEQILYKTGDLARYLKDGNIEFLGRIDNQVKIRGYRIEIGEIEALIKSHPSVQDSVVIVLEDKTGEKRLAAYIVSSAGRNEKFNEAALREYLKKQLPKYMVPGIFVQLDNIPLNANGKVDRFKLPVPDIMQRNSDDSFIAPRNRKEIEMAEIWAETLGIEKIGIDDDFFDLGGDSFKAIKLVRSISKSLGVMELFKNSTIRELTAYLSKDVSDKRTMLHELTKPIDENKRTASLICLPYGGGSAISYQPLANTIPKNYSLYAVELPGHDYSCPDEELASIEECASRCFEEIKENVKGPIVLYGHCLGASMAALLAYMLENAGIQVDGVFMGAMFPAPRISNRFFNIWDKIFPNQLTNKGNKDMMKTIGGLNKDISSEETEFILRNLSHDFKESTGWFTEVFKDKENVKFKAPITCIVGDSDRTTEFYQERYKEWEHFSENVDLKVIKYAGHFFFKNQAKELADIIKEKIDLWQGRTSAETQTQKIDDEMESSVKRKAPARKQAVPSMRLFLLVAVVQVISDIGTILSNFASGIWIYNQTGVLSEFAMMFLLGVVPTILMLPIAGAVVDRFDRRKILIVSDVLSAICSLSLLILLFNNGLQIWHVYVFTIVGAVSSSFRQPAYMAAVTQIVPKMYLIQANSVSQFSVAIGGIMAAVFGGLFMNTIGFKGLVMIDLVTFLISVTTLSIVRFPNTMFTRLEEPILKEIVGGWNFIIKRRSLVIMVIFFLASNFLQSIFDVIITPLVLSLSNPTVLGVINAFAGVGVLCGSIIMLTTGGTKKRAKGMVGFVIPLAISIMIGGIRSLPVFAALAMFGFYLSLTIVNIHWQSLIQVKVGLELQGRVFAVNQMLVSVLRPISYITAGILADRVFEPMMNNSIFNSSILNFVLGSGAGRGMRLTLLIAGAILLIWSIIGFRYKPLSEMDDILEDAIPGEIIIKDKDKLQEMADRRIGITLRNKEETI